ncbi:LysE family transporter [Alcaligenaceae bacterium]|nr:LysE family transporter [Alcaligenaceae bacterium]
MLPIAMPPALLSAWASGAATGLGLFAVVGAQSAFILRQGIMRSHLLAILMVCAAIDAVFIFASVLGLQAMTEWLPWLSSVILWFGVVFLLWYAYQSARRALRPQAGPAMAQQAMSSRRAALLGAVGFSLLNPHFWLDMMVVGSIAQNFQEAKLGFAAGTLTASTLWLIVLGAGSRLFAPLFSNAKAWRILDGMIALVMSFLALRLAMWS